MWAFERLGESRVSLILTIAFLLLGLGFLLICRPRQPASYLVLLMVVLVLGYIFTTVRQPANWIHFVQYPPLTLLSLSAIRHHSTGRNKFVWTLALVTLVGLGDEALQALLPERRFDPTDLVLNGVAALMTLALVGFVWEQRSSTDC